MYFCNRYYFLIYLLFILTYLKYILNKIRVDMIKRLKLLYMIVQIRN